MFPFSPCITKGLFTAVLFPSALCPVIKKNLQERLKGLRQLEETEQDLIVAEMLELSDKEFKTDYYAKGPNG